MSKFLTLALIAVATAPGAAAEPAIRVAVYADTGGSLAPKNVERCLSAVTGFATERITAEDIQAGKLAGFAVLIQPGGSGSKQAGELGEAGREAIRKFVKDGGGFIGICASAYLASADYTWSLNLLDAKVLDRQHWARGTGEVQIRMRPQARELLGITEELVTIHYGQGPLLAPAGKDDIPDYELLATYETEIAKNGAPEGVMKGTTAIARGSFGAGRVFCYSCHPEKTDGLDVWLQKAVRWSAAKAEAK